MSVLIIYCHPSKKSYTYDILLQLKSTLKEAGLKYEISDLYNMNFVSDMSELEYEREGLVNYSMPLPEDVKKEHEKISRSNCIIFLYPVWWSDCPSKLKGWFDRVYNVGYAYGLNEKLYPVKMKTLKYGLVLCTAGHPNVFLDEIGISKSMETIMMDDRLGKRFQEKDMIILGGTLSKDKVKAEHSSIIKNLGKKIKFYL